MGQQGVPVSDDERDAIADDIRAGKNRNDIARERDRSPSTISKIATDLGLSFDRTATQSATRAKTIDNKARRVQLAEDLLNDAQRLRERAWGRYEYYIGTREGAEYVTLAQPPLGEVRNAYAALGIVVDKHLALNKQDADNGVGTAGSLLGAMFDDLVTRHGNTPTE